MPTFRNITISVHSQYDAAIIPEEPLSPSRESTDSARLPRNESSDSSTPISNTIEVNIPTFPSSQLWISYACPPSAWRQADDAVRYYYFKLRIGGKDIVSWGVGEEEGWSGKTVYAPFAAGTDFEGKKVVEKRGFFFPTAPNGSEGGGFEIRVYRAKARRREATRYESCRGANGVDGAGVNLTNIGGIKKGERQRLYTYALIDAKDEPYITFKYSFQTANESMDACSEVSSPSSTPETNDETLSARKKADICGLRRLSVPPQRRLFPSTSHSEPFSPIKKAAAAPEDAAALYEGLDLAEAKRRDWVIRTPSPMVARLFDRPATPPSERKRVGTGALLRSVVGNALQRRE